MLDQMHATAALGHPHPTTDRRLWSHNTSGDWWERLVLGQWGDQHWVQNFRMHRGTFHELCTGSPLRSGGRTPTCAPPSPWKRGSRSHSGNWPPQTATAPWGTSSGWAGPPLVQLSSRSSTPSTMCCSRGSSGPMTWTPPSPALPPWGSQTAGELWTGPTSSSRHRSTERPSSSTGRAIAWWCYRHTWTTRDSSRTFTWGGPAGPTTPTLKPVPQAGGGHLHPPVGLHHRGRQDAGLHHGGCSLPPDGLADAARLPLTPTWTGPCSPVECTFGHLTVHFRCLLTHLDTEVQHVPEVIAACCVLHNIIEG
ncbi:uncharacterized protein LOC142830950 isoform X1 [Pelodiscus sinensis]|uniref:uncharacterized protein LOC142830950 isoform X1 n=1 Tax=Pelodiscus sinensis TaxID=13735 RepID=UPI003F6B0975